jgi:predicted aldo/keto reductase-like oxidoreductase
MEYRTFGKTGMRTSRIGFGGIVAAKIPQEEANRAVAEAIDLGVNYFDFAPTYYDAEERLGPALKGRRDDVYLACKTAERTSDGAAEELHRSLKRLWTDHFDIYQLHGVPNLEELNTIFSPGGAMETILKARDEGLVRFIGITTHFTDVALEAMRQFDFDSVLFPINFIIWHAGENGPDVLEAAAAKNMGRSAIKSMAHGAWPEGAEKTWPKCWYKPYDDPEMTKLAVRFTLSQDIHVLIPPSHLELWRMAVKAADNFVPLDKEEEEQLKAIAAQSTPLFRRTGEDIVCE